MIYVIEKGFNLYPNLSVNGSLYCKDCGVEVLESTIPHFIEDNRLFNKLPYDYALESDELMYFPTLREDDIVLEVSMVNNQLAIKAMSYSLESLQSFVDNNKRIVFLTLRKELKGIASLKDCMELTGFYTGVVSRKGITLRDFISEITRLHSETVCYKYIEKV